MTNKKIKTLIFTAMAVVTFMAFTGCNNQPKNSAPKIEGAHDMECVVNSTVDLLDGVVALDMEDGDITPSMNIEVYPHVEVTDGYAVFNKAGDYKVVYTACDSVGQTYSKSATISAVDRQTYIDFKQVSGFKVVTGGGASLIQNGMYDGIYKINAVGCEIAEDVQLVRTYALTNVTTYTFEYDYELNVSGRAYVTADSNRIAEVRLEQGENTLKFSYTPTGEDSAGSVEIALQFGGLGEEINFTLKGVRYGYTQSEGQINLLEGFTFNSENCLPRFDGTAGEVTTNNETATLNVISAGDAAWRGGMFINTGLTLQSGVEYTVSFDVTASGTEPFEVSIQRGQWDEYKYATQYYENVGDIVSRSINVTPDENTQGALWLYVQSGNYVNQITLSNLKVTTYSSGVHTENISLKDFTSSQAEGFSGELKTYGGSFSYTVESFSSTDWHQQVISSEFYLSGSGLNYVITFTASATKATEVIVAAPVYGGWDPTLAWQRITITEKEQSFAIWCSDNGGNTNYLVWQFGSPANVVNSNVTIEIKDIRVCYKNSQLDGENG